MIHDATRQTYQAIFHLPQKSSPDIEKVLTANLDKSTICTSIYNNPEPVFMLRSIIDEMGFKPRCSFETAIATAKNSFKKVSQNK